MNKKMLLILVLLLCLTGCKDKKDKEVVTTTMGTTVPAEVKGTTTKNILVECSNVSLNGPYKIESSYSVYRNGDYVSKVVLKDTVKADHEMIKNDLLNSMKKSYDEFNKKYGGYSYSVTTSDKSFTITVTMDYEKIDITKYLKDNEDLKKYSKDNKFLFDGIVNMYTQEGATCK